MNLLPVPEIFRQESLPLVRRMEKTGMSAWGLLFKKEICFDQVVHYYSNYEKFPEETFGIHLYAGLVEEIVRNVPRFNELVSMKYKYYLQSPEWRAKREVLIRIYGKCQLCGDVRTSYNIHHNSYKNKPIEGMGDLLVLCEGCHDSHHAHQREIKQYAKYMLSWIE